MLWRRLIIAGVAVVAILLTILAGSIIWLDSQSGRNFVARQIAAFEL
jgi:Na+-transporting methylmalonyl-CoA/oxaloacetate decarboxylase gamma subunit